MYDKYFTPLEADQLIPTVEKIIESIQRTQRALNACDRGFTALGKKISTSGGMLVDLDHWTPQRHEREALATKIAQDVGTLKELGVVLKDVETGLVDFPAVLEKEEIFLCWKSRETHIQYWHRTNEGYANRKSLTADVLSSSKDSKPVQ
jgi:hypothetical protein